MAYEDDKQGSLLSANSPQGSELPAYRLRCYRVGQTEFKRIAWSEPEFAHIWANYGVDDLFDAEVPSNEALRDEYLRLACLTRVPGAVETLETQYILPLATVLAKRKIDSELVEETLQLVRQKLLLGEQPRLAAYRSTGHFRAWLQVVAMRTCQDLARQRGVRWSREAPLMEQLVASASQPDVQIQKSELDEVFVEALREVIRGLPARERYALRMHVLAGWNVSQIGEALSTHRATAARWIAAAKERINENVRNILRERLDLSATELERLFSLLSTHFDARLSQVFNTTPALGAAIDEDDFASELTHD